MAEAPDLKRGRFLVPGGAGFIGSNFVRMIRKRFPDSRVTVLDKLTYAGNLANLESLSGDPGYRFIKGDICDAKAVTAAMEGCDLVVNFAAETHVDRSIEKAHEFVLTDTFGVYVLLEEARRAGVRRFLQVSTDEVYGEILGEAANEESPLLARNPYAASKIGGERLAYSYFATYGVPTIVTRGSNNYGPFQHPEKLIPLFVTNALQELPMPVYGTGKNTRDWIHVDDHCAAMLAILAAKDVEGETFNIGAGNEKSVLEITALILDRLKKPQSLIRHVTDRPGHDRRYAIDMSKLAKRTGFQPSVAFERGIAATIDWYVENRSWWESVRSGEYRHYYERMYGAR
ncbi:MAG: dTDP-glucose 4,6-dehydratase [Candidatus Eisenbacteria bacterium]|uniref:dTDP-glucose 4,6-dehydratase n=1 Tax=Eiseniibacteriota bacterium TaxID=2212470 RepID=A0A538SXY5_UNCEI|nr:MAG: dTDP-glucose 4,6-dehydratase [Candidatus Eisenbacteria bacterium]TMQ66531.1 MAG: dTDP-glucose 4,6-dehydratase [Candidatus Eisenbacteria bacterium]